MFRNLTLTILILVHCPAFGEGVTIISWYDYLAPDVVSELESKFGKINLITYKSNQMAIGVTQRNSSKADIFILSNVALDQIKKGDFISPYFSESTNERENFLPDKSICTPFSWFTTVFGYDSSEVKIVPESLTQILSKKDKYNLSIMDDIDEVSGRIMLDLGKSCALPPTPTSINLATWYNKCNGPSLDSIQALSPKDFQTSVTSAFSVPKTIAYGCQGEIAFAMSKKKSIKLVLPSSRPVYGVDSICIAKNPSTQRRLSEIKQIVDFLTSKKIAGLSSKYNQYFSPFKHHTTGLRGEYKQLRSSIISKIQTNNAVLMSPYTRAQHNQISAWWKKVRYGAKDKN